MRGGNCPAMHYTMCKGLGNLLMASKYSAHLEICLERLQKARGKERNYATEGYVECEMFLPRRKMA
jgi:hypothetical protein